MWMLEKLFISLYIGFCEWCQNYWYLWLGIKKCSLIYHFVQKLFPQTCVSCNWIYFNIYVENSFMCTTISNVWKIFLKNQKKSKKSQKTCNKTPFLVPGQRYQDFRHILPNLKHKVITNIFQYSHYCLESLCLFALWEKSNKKRIFIEFS